MAMKPQPYSKDIGRAWQLRQNKSTSRKPLAHIEDEDLKGKKVVFIKSGELNSLSPGQVAHIRGRIATMIRDHLEIADKVVRGEEKWTPTQARVFSTLLNKVVPDLSASFHQHEHKVNGIREMSRADLERIASGLDDPATIEAEYEEIKIPDSLKPEPATDADQEPSG